MSRRARIEAGFTSWGRLVVRRRWVVIGVCAAFSSLLVARLPELRVDNSDEAFLHADDPARIRYDRFKERFDREDRVLVVLRPERVFELGFLERLRALHRDLEREVPYVEEVTSLVNARNTRGERDELVVEDLMEQWPESAADVARLRARALDNPLYVDALFSADERYTAISLKPFTWSTLGPERDDLTGFDDAEPREGDGPRPLTEREGSALVEATSGVVARHAGADLEFHLVGGPTFDHRMTVTLQRDVSVFMTLSILMEMLLLALLFRRVSGVVLPVIVVLGSVMATMGFMVWVDIPFSVTLNMLPAFLLVVGLCDSVHILTIVYRRLAAGESREEAIAGALGHSGLAVVMTSVTTAAGLLSFRLAELAPIAQLGLLAPVGVMLAMAYSLALLPALLAVFPIEGGGVRRRAVSFPFLDRALVRAGDLSTGHARAVVIAFGAIVIAALPGLLQVRFSHDGIRWFPKQDPLRRAIELVDREFHGASSVEVVVDTGGENGLWDPDTLRRIERAMRFAETLRVDGRPVGKATSIVDVVKETHRALHDDLPEAWVVPDERALVAQELLLFENSGSDDLEDLTDSQLRSARISVRTPWADAMQYPVFLEEVGRGFDEILGDSASYELTGGAVLFTRVFNAVIHTMARSYAFALLVITPLMVLLIGSLKRGLVAMIPNLIPVYLVLAFMGATGIPLDAGTLLIGGVIIGLAVDDTIHFMHKFGRYYEAGGNPRAAVRQTLETTGSALLFTSLVLTFGFSVFLFAYMQNTFWFGLLALLATIVAFVADILLAPALMVLVTPRR